MRRLRRRAEKKMAYVQQKASGAWLVRWRVGGKLRSRQFPTREGAEAFVPSVTPLEATSTGALGRMQAKLRRMGREDLLSPFGGSAPEDVMTLARWLRQVVEDDRALGEGSRRKYLGTIRTYFDGTPLGETNLLYVGADQLEEWWRTLGAGEGARGGIKQILAKGFNAAVRRGVLESSPLKRATLAVRRSDPADIEALTVAQIERLASAAASPQVRAAVLIMSYGGLRAGEVAGLRVQDVDFERCRISVRQQIANGRVSPLKTKAARRTIGLACSVTDELRVAADGREDLIFRGRDGGPWMPRSIGAVVKQTARRSGMPWVHPHLLRHSAASLLIEAGTNAKVVQQFMGHSNVSITLNVYGHLFDYGADTAAEHMERLRQQATGQRGADSA